MIQPNYNIGCVEADQRFSADPTLAVGVEIRQPVTALVSSTLLTDYTIHIGLIYTYNEATKHLRS
jgi:hypothetical protein